MREGFAIEGASFEAIRGVLQGEITNIDQFRESNMNSNSNDVDVLFRFNEDKNFQIMTIFINTDEE